MQELCPTPSTWPQRQWEGSSSLSVPSQGLNALQHWCCSGWAITARLGRISLLQYGVLGCHGSVAPKSELVCAMLAPACVNMFMWTCRIQAWGTGSRAASHNLLVHITSPKHSSALLYSPLNRASLANKLFPLALQTKLCKVGCQSAKNSSYRRNQMSNLAIPGRIPPVKWPKIIKWGLSSILIYFMPVQRLGHSEMGHSTAARSVCILAQSTPLLRHTRLKPIIQKHEESMSESSNTNTKKAKDRH